MNVYPLKQEDTCLTCNLTYCRFGECCKLGEKNYTHEQELNYNVGYKNMNIKLYNIHIHLNKNSYILLNVAKVFIIMHFLFNLFIIINNHFLKCYIVVHF